MSAGGGRTFVVGTRAVIRRGPADYRVVCATCDRGGTTPHRSAEAANAAAIRDSGKPCRICGAA